jgi:hypothetical protein
MSITKRPDPEAIARFIAGAPDSKPMPAEAKAKPTKTAISLQLPTDLLARVDEAAAALSLTRSGFIKQALARAVQAESS